MADAAADAAAENKEPLKLSKELVDELIALSKQCSKICLKGCPAESFEEMTALLTEVAKVAPQFEPREMQKFNLLLQQIFAAQQISDLCALYDLLGYDLPYFLQDIRPA